MFLAQLRTFRRDLEVSESQRLSILAGMVAGRGLLMRTWPWLTRRPQFQLLSSPPPLSPPNAAEGALEPK